MNINKQTKSDLQSKCNNGWNIAILDTFSNIFEK